MSFNIKLPAAKLVKPCEYSLLTLIIGNLSINGNVLSKYTSCSKLRLKTLVADLVPCSIFFCIAGGSLLNKSTAALKGSKPYTVVAILLLTALPNVPIPSLTDANKFKS